MVPYPTGLTRYNDVDWLLRVSQAEGFAVMFPDTREPLAIWHQDGQEPTMSRRGDWKSALRFARERRGLFTRRAYASFLLTLVTQTAAAEGRVGAIPPILWEALRHGRPGPVDLAACASIWLVPRRLRTRWTSRSTPSHLQL